MAMPDNIGIIDCMLGIPETENRSDWFESFKPLIKDAESRQQFSMPAHYMFKDIPESGAVDDFASGKADRAAAPGDKMVGGSTVQMHGGKQGGKRRPALGE